MDDVEKVARAIVAEAGPRMRAAWCESKVIEHKGAIDLVTETDREIERLVVHRLRRAFPDHLIIGEEASAGSTVERPPPDRHTWYVDPLDGTTNFAHGYPVFALSLALVRDGKPQFGIVHDPVREETFAARSGAGATLNGATIRVSSAGDLGQALIATGFPYDTRARADFYLAFFGDFVRRAQGVRRGGAAALDLCYVACGRLDGFFEWQLHPWDTAAGSLICREAGGVVTDFLGAAFDLHGNQTLASNGRIQEQMIEVLRTRLAAHDS